METMRQYSTNSKADFVCLFVCVLVFVCVCVLIYFFESLDGSFIQEMFRNSWLSDSEDPFPSGSIFMLLLQAIYQQ